MKCVFFYVVIEIPYCRAVRLANDMLPVGHSVLNEMEVILTGLEKESTTSKFKVDLLPIVRSVSKFLQ